MSSEPIKEPTVGRSRIIREIIVEDQREAPLPAAAFDPPEGKLQLDIDRECQHLFANLGGALRSGPEAKPYTEALLNREVTIHGHSYRFEQCVGRGSFGLAMLAKRLDTGDTVVIKLSRPYDHQAVDGTEKFSKEKIFLARSAMAEIASLHRLSRDADGQRLQRRGDDPPFPILLEAVLLSNPLEKNPATDMRVAAEVLEYIDGSNMARDLKQAGNFSGDADKAKQIALKLVQAVRRMHAAGVLHLDIKPHNIMLDENDDPILLDFGASQIPSRGLNRRTQASINWATPINRLSSSLSYTTEQDKTVIGRVENDIYSLGMTLNDMLYGLPSKEVPREQLRTKARATLLPELLMIDDVVQAMTNPNIDQRPTLAAVEQTLTTQWQRLQDAEQLMAVQRKIAS